MPKVRQILGHASVEVASRSRICHRARKKHEIVKGDACLVMKEGTMAGKKNYCLDCAREILEQAQEDLNGLKEALDID